MKAKNYTRGHLDGRHSPSISGEGRKRCLLTPNRAWLRRQLEPMTEMSANYTYFKPHFSPKNLNVTFLKFKQ